jgi:nicotinamidase-related amidase
MATTRRNVNHPQRRQLKTNAEWPRTVPRGVRGPDRALAQDREEIRTMADPLLVVDVQRCFLNGFTQHIPARIARLIARGEHAPILFTRFVNATGGPYHRYLDWHDCACEPGTNVASELEEHVQSNFVFAKPGYAGISDELADHLREHGYEQIVLAGIDTDMCVLKVALDVFDLGIRPIVLVDCCASTAGLQSHLAGLAVLARNIGADQLRDAGLGEGWLGAPKGLVTATR